MAKGAKRQRVKDALSPVRNILSPSSHPDAPDNGAAEDADLLDDLMAQLDNRDKTVQGEAATVIQEITTNREVNESPMSIGSSSTSLSKSGRDSRDRFNARKERKAAKLAEQHTTVDHEADARLAEEAKEEEKAITSASEELGLQMHEISPDGHCMFSAIADQLSLLSLISSEQATYATTRHAAATYMRAHPNDFIPFLPSVGGEDGVGSTDDGIMTPQQYEEYCSTIANTGQWGGEPEILALSRAFSVPIHVVQGGAPRVVKHTPGSGPLKSEKPVYISYHRRMYGLGEHYNSLRPKKSKLGGLLH